MKYRLFSIVSMAMLALAACSENSSTGTDPEVLEDETFSTENGSSAVVYKGDGIFYTDKAYFNIDTSKQILSIYTPECKVQKDTLYWSDGKTGKATTISYKYNSSSQSINLEENKKKLSMKFYGDSFPYGQWIEPNSESGLVYNGYALHASGKFNYTKYFGDSCLVDNLKTIHGFLGFKDNEKMEKVSCNTAKYGDVDVIYEKYSAGSSSLKISKGKKSCSVSITPRFKANEEDCQAAYDDYKDAADNSPFNFDNYSLDISGDVSCFNDMLK